MCAFLDIHYTLKTLLFFKKKLKKGQHYCTEMCLNLFYKDVFNDEISLSFGIISFVKGKYN